MTDGVGEQLRQLLGERYRIEREIARGGMATVYLATDLRHDRQVALKVMHPEVALALGRERFLREIRLAAKLSHPNILTLHDSGEAGGFLYYVMPFVEGETLRHKLEATVTLPIEDAVRLVREAAEAIGYAHSLGIVHRDIKPENILLSRGHAVVADFGIARAIDAARDDRVTATGTSLGTPAYMSPEQALAEDVDARSDVWALGCVLYETLTGSPPFGRGGREVLTKAITGRPDPVTQHRAEVPRHVVLTIDRALAREPRDRFANASEFADALHSTASMPSVVMQPPVRARRPAWLPIAAGFLLLVAALAAATVISQRDSGARSSDAGSSPKIRMSTDSQANELYRLGRLQQGRRTAAGVSRAISLYTQALERDSTFARAWAQLVWSATFAYRRGFEVPGISPDSLIALAVHASERAIELDPQDPVSWLVKARASKFVDPADLTPALSALERSLTLDSTNADAWFERGIMMEELLSPDEALANLHRAASLNPSDPQPVAFISLNYLWRGDYDPAARWADSAVRMDPTYVLARQAAGQVALELGRLADALRHYDAGVRVTSGREQALELGGKARALVALGDSALARRELARSKTLFDLGSPNSHEASYIAPAFTALGDTAGALSLLAAYQPRADLHYQLHLKKDPALRWLRTHPSGSKLLTSDPKPPQPRSN